MSRVRVLTKPQKVKDLNDFDEFYDEIRRDWQRKAEQLRVRRLRKLKHVKGSRHPAH